MPFERFTCVWEDNTETDVKEMVALFNTTMNLKVLWKAGYFLFSIFSLLFCVFCASFVMSVE
jgi:hypothetical protein